MWDETEDDEVVFEEVEELEMVLDDIPKKRTRRKKNESSPNDDYVNKDEMWQELFDYYKSLGSVYDWDLQKVNDKNVFPKISNRLTTIINDIATKMGYRANFCRYSWLDEMIGDAVLKMIKAVRDCSFKCYTIAEIIAVDNFNNTVTYYDKKGQVQNKPFEDTDTYFEGEDHKDYIKFKANPFGYFSRITSHSYLNRIKKEKDAEKTKRAFQEETWERLYSNENFRNVRRQKIIDSDENEVIFDE